MELSGEILSYRGLKERAKMQSDNLSACDTLLQIGAAMSEYGGADADKLATNFLEMYLLSLGAAAIVDASIMPAALGTSTDEGLLVCIAQRAGTPNANGQGRDLIVSTLDGRVKTIRNFETEGKDKVVYVKNNLYATPDLTIGTTGDLITEYYESMRHNIVNSRLTPVISVPDEQSKNSVENAQKANRLGSYMVVVSDNVMGDGKIEILHPTDVKDQDKIQYLNHAYDDIIRHWYNLHGMDISGASKQAQMSVDEVSSGTNSRKCLPFEMLAERKRAMARVREVFGIDVTVDFSEPWRLEFGMTETPVDASENGETPDEIVEDNETTDDNEEIGEEVKEDGKEDN